MGALYQIVSPSGKTYIGITSKSAEDRFRQHKYNQAKGRGKRAGEECAALYDAMRKYGPENFYVKTLVIGSFDYVKLLEPKVIAAFNTKSPNGYNLTDGGEGAVGAIPTDEARKKMSEAQIKRLQDKKERDAVVASVNKASKIKAEKWWSLSEDERAKKREEHAQKLKEANRFTPEVRAAISAKAKGKKKPKTEEQKLNSSIAAKKRWSDKAEREKQSLRSIERWKSQEARDRQSETLKRVKNAKA